MMASRSPRSPRTGALFIFGVAGLLAAAALRAPSAISSRDAQLANGNSPVSGLPGQPSLLTKQKLAEALSGTADFYEFPRKVDIPIENGRLEAELEYAFDPDLQVSMQQLMGSYAPDFGAFVAMDAQTGRVLSMVSYARDGRRRDNLALRSTFPSASVFKVVTAAAAIQSRKFSADTIIPFNGRNHTLYRRNILKTDHNRWTRYITLKDAFAQSVNTVFGRIGAFELGQSQLRLYADRFGFNRAIAADFPIRPGTAPVPSDPWGLAETASGFTRDNRMSPLQGALIAASIVNDGVMMEPYVVRSVRGRKGELLYSAQPNVANMAVDPRTAGELRELMRQTVKDGTSRKSFHGFFRREFAFVDVGGKTGSLTGTEPAGKYDWFVGFAQRGGRRIAVAALTIHQKQWRVKSSFLARKAIENYFSRNP